MKAASSEQDKVRQDEHLAHVFAKQFKRIANAKWINLLLTTAKLKVGMASNVVFSFYTPAQ